METDLETQLRQQRDGEIPAPTDSGIAIDIPITDSRPTSRDGFDPGGPRLLNEIQRHYVKSSKLGNKFLFQLTQRGNEMAKYNDKRRHTQESILQMVETFLGQREQTLPNIGPQSLQNLKTQLANDGLALQTQAQSLQDLDTRIGTTEYKLKGSQSKLMKALNKYNESTSVFTQTDNDLGAGLSTPSVTSEDLPEQARAYFDAVGSLSILQERIHEIEMEHSEARTRRNMAIDQERALSTSSSVFEDTHQAAREELIRNLEDKNMAADHAKKVCEEQGIDLDAWQHRQSTDTSQADESLFEEPGLFPMSDRSVAEILGLVSYDIIGTNGAEWNHEGSVDINGDGNDKPDSTTIESWLSNTINGDDMAETHAADAAELPRRMWLRDTDRPDYNVAAGSALNQDDSMVAPRSGVSRRKAVRAFHQAAHRRCSVSAIDAEP